MAESLVVVALEMASHFRAGTRFSLEGADFKVCEHPNAPGRPHALAGSSAVVYRVRSTDKELALKVFKPAFRRRLEVLMPECADKLGRAARDRGQLLPGTATVKLYPELLYSVHMPWVDGPTWEEIRSSRQRLDEPAARTMALQLARMVECLETAGLGHCDLSADNLLVTEQRTLNLIDLENLRAIDDPQQPIPEGSHRYLPASWSPSNYPPAVRDRYPLALLVAEFLLQSSPDWFDGPEPSSKWSSCNTYRQLASGLLSKNWDAKLGQMLSQVLSSDTPWHCPSADEWRQALFLLSRSQD